MASSILTVNQSGTWKRPKVVSVKDGGVWTACKAVWMYQDGVWYKSWAPNAMDPTACDPTVVLSNSDRTMSVTSAPPTATIYAAKTLNGFPGNKWYYEISWTRTAGTDSQENIMLGVCDENFNVATGQYVNYCMYYGKDSGFYVNDVLSTQFVATSPTPAQLLTCAFDADAQTITFYKNGVIVGTTQTIPFAGPYYPAFGVVKKVSNTMTITIKTTMSYPNARPATTYQALTL